MVTLAQFREITEGLPGDFEIRIEACFTPEGNKTASCFEMMYSKERRKLFFFRKRCILATAKQA